MRTADNRLMVLAQTVRAGAKEIEDCVLRGKRPSTTENALASLHEIADQLEAAAHEGEGSRVEGEPWLVWSHEHYAWWGPNHSGYFTSILAAGIYTEEQAREIERHANGASNTRRHEKAIPLSEATLPAQRPGTVAHWLHSHPEPIDTTRLDFLDALLADHDGCEFSLADGKGTIWIRTLGAVDVRTVLDAAMRAATTEATNAGA